jgi:hypothetical protein
LGLVEEVSWVNAEGGGETNDVSQADVALPALDATHVCAMDPRFGRESFLAQSGPLAQSSHSIAESLQGVVFHRSVV